MPKRFFFWEALPKSGYGKITKKDVREELEARGLPAAWTSRVEARPEVQLRTATLRQ